MRPGWLRRETTGAVDNRDLKPFIRPPPEDRRRTVLQTVRALTALTRSASLWLCTYPHPAMNIYGIDFTSRPRRGKPITCLACVLEVDRLQACELLEWHDFSGFEALLRRPGPWLAGIDFPFGQARRFIENIGWPRTWQGYVAHVAALERAAFRRALDDYRSQRPAGDKEHRRACDQAAGAISPQKLYGIPVGLMFFEGAPRLMAAGVTLPGLQRGDPKRIAVEAYPGLLARTLVGRRPYKQDSRRKQTPEQQAVRTQLLNRIVKDDPLTGYGIRVEAPLTLADDPTGDRLDALLCAVQAAWAWRAREDNFGIPPEVDGLEGWIADPGIRRP